MTYNVCGGTLNFAQSHPISRDRPHFDLFNSLDEKRALIEFRCDSC